MRYVTIDEVLEIYSRVMRQAGGTVGIRDMGAWSLRWRSHA